MKKFLIFILLISIGALGRTQEETSSYKHSVGLHAGIASGYGFSYRFWPKRIGFQVTAIPLFSNDRLVTSTGLSLLCTINDFSKLRLYSYLGNHYRYERYSYPYQSNYPNDETSTYTVALGVGVRVNFLEVLDFNVQAGYGAGFTHHNYYSYDPFQYSTTLDIGAGLYFHF